MRSIVEIAVTMPYIAYICEIWHSTSVKPVIWMGGSREDVKRLPEGAQDSLGFELYRVQCGLDPRDWKPMNSVGPVLHCFQKKTQRTSRSDLELAMKRFKLIVR